MVFPVSGVVHSCCGSGGVRHRPIRGPRGRAGGSSNRSNGNAGRRREVPLIGAKPGLQIDDASALSSALVTAKARLNAVAIGCPQKNGLGPEPGACDGLFVLAVDVSPGTGSSAQKALAFVFVRRGDAFELRQVDIEPYLDVEYGGLALGFALPLDLTGGRSGLWYTPWKR